MCVRLAGIAGLLSSCLGSFRGQTLLMDTRACEQEKLVTWQKFVLSVLVGTGDMRMLINGVDLHASVAVCIQWCVSFNVALV